MQMFSEYRKKMTELDICSNCGICTVVKTIDVCPQIKIDEKLYEDTMPRYLISFISKSKDKNILDIAQDGGTTTTILKYLLENKIVDYVLTIKLGNNLTPIPVLINNPEKVLECSGSKYLYTPLLVKIKDILKNSSVCIVGLPCHLRALNNAKEMLDNANIVKIGLLCSHNFKREMYINIAREYNFNINDIYRMEIKKNMFRIYVKNLGIIEKPLKDLEKYVSKCCKQCPELIPHYADIAVGSMFVPDKHNIVFVLSERGKEILEKINYKEILNVDPISEDVIVKISKVAKRKAERALKFREEILKTINSEVLSR